MSTPLTDSSISDIPAIPTNGLLLHIGVFKTGTTALQETLHRSPEALDPAKVLYLGPHTWHRKSLLRLLRRNDRAWAPLEETIQSHSGRVIVSAEGLCMSSDDEAERIVASLGKGRPVHILITVRSLADMLPSTWQQFLKRGSTEPFDSWLESVLSDTEKNYSSFRRRNDFPRLLDRWGKVVGEENITLVVSDKRQPERLLRVVEQLQALKPNTLRFRAAGRTNRSLSFPEAELLRQVNMQVAELLNGTEYKRLVRLGVFPALYAQDGPSGSHIPLPTWAADAIAEVGAAQAETLRESSASIVGDIDAIAGSSVELCETLDPPDLVPMNVSSAAVVGALSAAHRSLNEPRS